MGSYVEYLIFSQPELELGIYVEACMQELSFYTSEDLVRNRGIKNGMGSKLH